MPWEKSFDVSRVRRKAMEILWTQGYDATSMQNLLDAMGIHRGSFYNTFSSKHQVLLDALHEYDLTLRRTVFETARHGRSPKESILHIFRSVAAEASRQAPHRGCFLVNCALELAPRDPEVAAIVRRSFAEIERFFRVAIEQGEKLGEVPRGVNAQSTSRALLGMLLGIRVLSRLGARRSTIEGIVKQATLILG